jgi:hypothetical protein
MKKNNALKKVVNFIPIIFPIAVLIFSLISIGILHLSPKTPLQTYPELREISGQEMKFEQIRGYFRNLANQKGALYAYDVLKLADLPKGTDMHLMGHAVGEILYEQMGAGGMQYCTPDFRNACSHTIVVGLLLDKGEQALKEIDDACKKAPGGSGAYFMCYHGLGHGVLAYTDFDFPKSLELCKKVGSEQNNFREYGECVGGMVMEQISGGDHDKQKWSQQRKVNLKDQDRLYPCNSNLLKDSASRTFCYLYVTPNLFPKTTERGFPKPTNGEIKEAYKHCDRVLDEDDFRTCYGGFGKEFVVFAKERDIRNIGLMKKEELKKVYDWCMLSDNIKGQDSCLASALASLFWGGENNPQASLDFCTLHSENLKENCYKNLTLQAKRYLKPPHLNNFCVLLPHKYQHQCIN